MLVSGILLGGVYGCVAVGFSLITGVLKVFNFAHGAFVMLGAYVTYLAFSSMRLDPFLSIPLAMIALFLIGYLFQRVLINRVIRAPLYMTLILTFGLDMVLVNGALLAWTGNLRSVVPKYASLTVTVGSVNVPVVRLAAFVCAMILTVLLYILMNKTKM
jgi:branched-chain amino acid transport system permease protein